MSEVRYSCVVRTIADVWVFMFREAWKWRPRPEDEAAGSFCMEI